MKILAVEFSSEKRSVALVQAAPGEPPRVLGRTAETGGRRVIGLIEETLQTAGCEREEVELIAVGLGPGSYTGIRGAIALAQGWQLGRAVKLIGISSIACLAAQAAAEKIRGLVNIVVDAQRQEFYLARYEIADGSPREIEPLRLAAKSEITGTVVGPDLTLAFPQSINIYPDAAVLGQLVAGRTDFISGDILEPIYLRETNFKKAPPRRIIA